MIDPVQEAAAWKKQEDERVDQLAQVAYRAYGQTTDFKNYQGKPMPDWVALPENIRTAWRASARAVVGDVDPGYLAKR